MPPVADAVAAEDLSDRAHQDPQVQQERAMFHIPDIVLELLFPADSVAPVDLRPPGDPGTDFVAPRLPGSIQRQILHQ